MNRFKPLRTSVPTAGTASLSDKIAGSLIGGAVGDALGYPVEFMNDHQIRSAYGEQGIVRYALNRHGIAEISDDTQMSLFTANGLLLGAADGFAEPLENYVRTAYIEWYGTQTGKRRNGGGSQHRCRLSDLPEMYAQRAPGTTCLNALYALGTGRQATNDSKGCGGIMRTAPVGLFAASYRSQGIVFGTEAESLANVGAETARITHKHPLGFLPAALLTHIVFRAVLSEQAVSTAELENIVSEALAALPALRERESGLPFGELYPNEIRYLNRLTEKAVHLAHTDIPTRKAVPLLGQGWVAEETLAIAVYCSVKHKTDFEKAVTAAVNHSGDSDSTGAVTGNIIGAVLGRKAVPDHYTERLEMKPIIEELADALTVGYMPGIRTTHEERKRRTTGYGKAKTV